MQVNSDSRATQEYMDFLLGKITQETSEDGPSVIVGPGKIGSMLLDFGKRKGFEDVVVKRGDKIPEDHPGPVYVCTQAADLEAVIAACPENKKDDLVFMQDGMLEPLFQRNGLYGPTQAALYLAILRVGGRPLDGTTSDAPEGLTTVTGKWAEAFAMRMKTGELSCHVRPDRDARRAVMEKAVFTTAYQLVGACYGGLNVGEVAKHHQNDVDAICRELASFIRYTFSVSLFSGLDERLNVYAQKMEFLPCTITEFEFRNGFFYKYSKMAGSRVNAAGLKVEVPDTTPGHTDYLKFAVEEGVITQSMLDEA